MVLSYLSHNCKLPLVEIQGKHDPLAEFWQGPRHSGFATPWQPPVAGPAMVMNDGAMHAAHCEYQGPAARRSRGSFRLAKQKFCFECDRKFVVHHQIIIKQYRHYRPWCGGFTLWGSPHVNDIPRAPTRHLIHSCRRHVRNLLHARGDFIGYWRFILQL